MSTESTDNKKKKKLHPWPMALIIALAIFMGSIVYAVTIMVGKDVPLVAENYYEEELKYQDQIDIEQRTLASGRVPKLLPQEGGRSLVIQFSPNSKISMGAGKISFERPADPSLDFSVPVNPDGENKQFIDLGSAKAGLYLLRISWREDGLDYYHEIKYSFK